MKRCAWQSNQAFLPLGFALLCWPAVLFAADVTAPTTPVVTDDGAYTAIATSLHATWTSADPESGIAEYQYLIQQDSPAGPIIVNWTSTGLANAVTRTGLSLLQGKIYYINVRARNGAGLWSAVGSSNGIKVDTTAPIAPGLPTEGSTIDKDYDGDGAYYIYWPAASDAESGIAAYQYAEQSSTGIRTVWTGSTSAAYVYVSGRVNTIRYTYQVRAKNGAGLWSLWSAFSDGILIDTSAPAPVLVTDDGATTTSTTSLHASWTASSDAESGIADYQYQILQDSTVGTITVNWTSTGSATSVTRSSLSLLAGKTYFFCVRARNGALLLSPSRCSDGILVQPADTTPPTLNSISPQPSPSLYAGNTLTLSASVTDTDPSPLEYQFSVDGTVKQAWSATATYPWVTTSTQAGSHTIMVEVRDAGGAQSKSQTVYLYLKPPGPP